MATNAELTEENEMLRGQIEALIQERDDALHQVENAAPAANAGLQRRSFEMSQGTANDLDQAAARTAEDGQRRAVTDVGSGSEWAVSRNADGKVRVQRLDTHNEN